MVPCGHNVALHMPDAAIDVEDGEEDETNGDGGSEPEECGADAGGPRGKRKAQGGDRGSGAASNKSTKRKASSAPATTAAAKGAAAPAVLPVWTARWVPWAGLATLGLTLASQKVHGGRLLHALISFRASFWHVLYHSSTSHFISVSSCGHLPGFGTNHGAALATEARRGGSCSNCRNFVGSDLPDCLDAHAGSLYISVSTIDI